MCELINCNMDNSLAIQNDVLPGADDALNVAHNSNNLGRIQMDNLTTTTQHDNSPLIRDQEESRPETNINNRFTQSVARQEDLLTLLHGSNNAHYRSRESRIPTVRRMQQDGSPISAVPGISHEYCTPPFRGQSSVSTDADSQGDIPRDNSHDGRIVEDNLSSTTSDDNYPLTSYEEDNRPEANSEELGIVHPNQRDNSSDDTYSFDERIQIPKTNDRFNFGKLWAFTGPGFLILIAFLNPRNVESNLQAGIDANYKLLWILLSATVLGLVMQRLSARLGVVTGLHLAEMCYRQFSTIPRILLWIITEIAIIGSNMQEVIGSAIALYLLSSKALPIWAGILLTIVNTLIFLALDKYGIRKLEFLFGFFIIIMIVTFGYEYVVSAPPQGEIMKGMFIPWCEYCDSSALLQAVGIIGANVQPHNLYLHSALVKSRNINRKEPNKVREANMYFFTEAAIALFISFLINLFVMAAFAYGLYGKTNADVYGICASHNFTMGTDIFKNNNETFTANLYNGGIFLGCQFGFAAMIIWAIGVLVSGQASAMTSTYAG